MQHSGQSGFEEQPQALLFTGEAVGALSSEQRETLVQMVGEMTGGLTVEASVILDTSTFERQAAEKDRAIPMEGYTPQGILDLHREVQYAQDTGLEAAYTRLSDGFFEGLKKLCTTDPEKAASTYEIMSRSEEVDVKKTCAVSIPNLGLSAHSSVADTWVRLLTDPDPSIRQEAYESLDIAVERSLKPEEVAQLLRTARQVNATRD